MRTVAFLLLTALLLAGPARAQEARLPTEIVDNFHRALKAGDTGRVLSMMDRELIVFEYGVADLKLEAYAFAHLPMDMDQAVRTQWELQTRRMGGAGDERWVLSTYHVTGPAGANTPAIDQTTAETVILRRIGDGFRIAHVHWSTADVKK
jgi:ketosteroid isomerase-like protein